MQLALNNIRNVPATNLYPISVLLSQTGSSVGGYGAVRMRKDDPLGLPKRPEAHRLGQHTAESGAHVQEMEAPHLLRAAAGHLLCGTDATRDPRVHGYAAAARKVATIRKDAMCGPHSGGIRVDAVPAHEDRRLHEPWIVRRREEACQYRVRTADQPVGLAARRADVRPRLARRHLTDLVPATVCGPGTQNGCHHRPSAVLPDVPHVR